MNCIIVDDEALARELLADYVSKIPNLELVGSFEEPLKAKTFLATTKVDLLFLDIQMPNLTGIEFLKIIAPKPMVILTTAYEEYALEGYELAVMDYLVKPIPFERFYKAVNKAQDFFSLKQENKEMASLATSESPLNNETYFFVKSAGKLIKICYDEIRYIEGFREYVRIYTEDNNILTLLSLSKLEEILPINQFFRVHKSYIINLDKIENIEGDSIKIGRNDIPISRRNKKEFLERLNKYGLF